MRIVDFHTDSRPESLCGVRRQIRDAILRAGLGADTVATFEVAIGEVLANTYVHAYRRGMGPVFVAVCASPDAVTVVIRDDGVATVPPPIPLERPSTSNPGGRGLYLAGQLADDMSVGLNPGGHGVTVRLAARLTAANDARAEPEDEPRNDGG